MDRSELGVLERTDVRQAWQHEAHDFTPWLAENLDRLSSAVGIGLEREGTEVQIGPYRADIVARAQDGTQVLIENQLEEANLQHLGQVLAYLAGLEAETVVWIATGFNEAHLSAIRWAERTHCGSIRFFCGQIRSRSHWRFKIGTGIRCTRTPKPVAARNAGDQPKRRTQ